MVEVPSASVSLVVTSPPYWNIKDYGVDGQVGFGQNYGEYLSSLETVWGECSRVLRDGCRLAVNVGDQFLRASEAGSYQVVPVGADVLRTVLEHDFHFMGSIIWRKVSTTKTTGGGCWMGSQYYPGDGHVTFEHEYIHLFRKYGKRETPGDLEVREASKLTKQERSHWFRGVWDDVPPVRQVNHCAMFPKLLPERLIRMYTYVGEAVLDPFAGSGTTLSAAHDAGRCGAGFELNREFETLMRDKVPGLEVTYRLPEGGQL